MSDFHEKYPVLHRFAPVLALLGDIGNPKSNAYKEFLKHASLMFEIVLVVAGNHEYYGSTIDEANNYISQACNEAGQNVHFLNRSFVHFYGIKFIGATLWSNITYAASIRLNCFRRIFENKDHHPYAKLQMQTYLDLHRADLAFIQKEIDDTPCVILTHYAPLLECNGCYMDTPQASGFATDLKYLYENRNILAHLYGHTHVNGKWFVNNAIITCNCKGYYNGECKGMRFDPTRTIEVDMQTHDRIL